MFFSLNSWQLALVLAGILFGATAIGLLVGRYLRRHSETLREPFGVVQAALLTLVALLLAFTLAMAVTRYEARRAAVVDDSNAIGTAYLRAQTLHEPMRSASLRALSRVRGREHPRFPTRCPGVPRRSARSRRNR